MGKHVRQTDPLTKLEPAFSEVAALVERTRTTVMRTANVALIDLYWAIGEYLSVRCIQQAWGKSTVTGLAELIRLRRSDWRGFSAQNLWRMKQFFELYVDTPKLSTLLRELPWTANLHIVSKCKSEEERFFYLQRASREHWSERDVEREIDSGLFERTLGNGSPMLSTALREMHADASAMFKDSYLVDFLNLPPAHSERDLQRGLVNNLKSFLLELGSDFCFIGEEYRLSVGAKDFYVDLLFYHRTLNCLVAVELKIDDFKPEHLGQLNFYLEALDRDHKKPHENPTVGLLLCKTRDREVVEYALSRTLSSTLVAEYQTKLIDKQLLQAKMQELYAKAADEQKNQQPLAPPISQIVARSLE